MNMPCMLAQQSNLGVVTGFGCASIDVDLNAAISDM